MNQKENLRQLKGEVFAKQTVLAKIHSEHGQDSLFDYVNGWQVGPAPSDSDDFLAATEELLAKIYGPTLAAQVVQSLKRQFLVSTIDHHGLLNHPFFLNSNLIFSLRSGLSYSVCLTTAGISLNNSSWPGCLVKTVRTGEALKRYSLFPDKIKTCAVLALPPFYKENADRLTDRIADDPDLGPKEKKNLAVLVKEIFLDERILGQPDFSSQASLLSTEFWKKIFSAAPAIIYLPVEKLVATLLAEKIAKDSGHILHRLLFTVEGWDLVEKHFEGSLGAFSSSHKGSFLFWGIGSKGRRFRLGREGEALAGGGFTIIPDAQAISQALTERRLYPTSLACFLTLLHYQVTCLGGFNQVNWLTDIKQKFMALLLEAGEKDMAEKVSNVPTENYAEGNLAFLLRHGRPVKATGIDILLAPDNQLYDKYRRLAKLMTVGESIESLLPEIYRVITPEQMLKKELAGITDEDIIRINGTEGRLKSLLT